MNVAKSSLIWAITMLGACGLEPLNEYVPIVDSFRVDEASFNKDLQQCRAIALNVEAEYRTKQEEQMWKDIGTGLLTGVLMGAAVGAGTDYQKDFTAYGAAAGTAAGISQNDYTYDLVKFGPRRVVDRCMSNRGHKLLNDEGR